MSPTSDRKRSTQTDREYYAELWGTTPAAQRRESLTYLRQRSGFIAALAALTLAAQLLWTTVAGSDRTPRIEISPAIGGTPALGGPASADGEAERGERSQPRVRSSSAVGEFPTDRAND